MKTKKKTVKKYMTCNLDEAAYLAMNGLKCKPRCIDMLSAKFYFEGSAKQERLRKQFWATTPKINLHSWLAMRQGIKNELKAQLKIESKVSLQKVTVTKDMLVEPGITNAAPYQPVINGKYYVVVAKGQVVSYLFGKKPIHQERVDKGLTYQTRKEAMEASLKIK